MDANNAMSSVQTFFEEVYGKDAYRQAEMFFQPKDDMDVEDWGDFERRGGDEEDIESDDEHSDMDGEDMMIDFVNLDINES